MEAAIHTTRFLSHADRFGRRLPLLFAGGGAVTNPGQATSYMVGQLKIFELRDRARAALGDRFDIKDFHSAVLDGGAVPLDVLEEQVDAWIAAGGGNPAR